MRLISDEDVQKSVDALLSARFDGISLDEFRRRVQAGLICPQDNRHAREVLAWAKALEPDISSQAT